jgi:hypothetical protein
MEKNVNLIIAGASSLSLVVGTIAGYSFSKYKLGKEFDKRLSEEIDATRRHYQRNKKHLEIVEEKEDENDIPSDAKEALIEYQGGDPDEELEMDTRRGSVIAQRKYTRYHKGNVRPGDVVAKIENQNEGEEPSNNQEDEVRDRNRPYVISSEEFFQNESDHEQVTVSYIVEDQTLLDGENDPIKNFERMTGPITPHMFGLRSGEPHIVYIRNEEMATDLEVVRIEGEDE